MHPSSTLELPRYRHSSHFKNGLAASPAETLIISCCAHRPVGVLELYSILAGLITGASECTQSKDMAYYSILSHISAVVLCSFVPVPEC